MMGNNDNMEMTAEAQAELILRQLTHLKRYEAPDAARMTRSKQNIMRKVRQAQGNRRQSLGDLIEVSMPWFFAEPKYGIAALFIAFAGLQYLATNAEQASRGTGIYTSSMADIEPVSVASTNTVSYPQLPDNLRLFQDGSGAGSVKFVEHLRRK